MRLEPQAPALLAGSGVSPRRRAPLRRHSGFIRDAFCGAVGRGSVHGNVGSLRSAVTVQRLPQGPDAIGAVVVDSPQAPGRQ